MSKEMQGKLVKTSLGRVILHVACLLSDYRFEWHLKGIVREIEGNVS